MDRTGQPGAGQTSLLSHGLNNHERPRVAVILNVLL